MTGKNYKYEFYEVDHTRFGGIIYPSDFDTRHTNGNIASRIENDRKFDEKCRKNIKQIKQGGKKN